MPHNSREAVSDSKKHSIKIKTHFFCKGDSNLDTSCDFFTKYWSTQLKTPLASLPSRAGSDYGLFYKENDIIHLRALFAHINSLNYHVNLIERLFDSKPAQISQTSLSSFLDVTLNLIHMYKYYYKRFVLLNEYLKEKSGGQFAEIVMLMLNASSLLKTTSAVSFLRQPSSHKQTSDRLG